MFYSTFTVLATSYLILYTEVFNAIRSTLFPRYNDKYNTFLVYSLPPEYSHYNNNHILFICLAFWSEIYKRL